MTAILWRTPLWIGAVYVMASVVAFLAYGIDKRSASAGWRRTPESTLHILSLLGGWPGALIAQQFLRHKSTKRVFRQVFWATVVANILAFLILATPLLHYVFAE